MASIQFIKYLSELGPSAALGNIGCRSKSTIELVFDEDGAGGDFGVAMNMCPPAYDWVIVQVMVKYNLQFPWQTGGLVELMNFVLEDGDKVWLANQSNPAENGIYIARSGAWEFDSEVTSKTLVDLGARAYDSIDGDLTRQIVTEYLIDFTQIGLYSINYYVVNSSGILSTIRRSIRVKQCESSIVPTNHIKITDLMITSRVDSSLFPDIGTDNNCGNTGCTEPEHGESYSDILNTKNPITQAQASVIPDTTKVKVTDLKIVSRFETDMLLDLLGITDCANAGCDPLPPDTGIYIKKDGTVVYVADQSMGGFRVTNATVGSDIYDSVTLNQLIHALENVNAIFIECTSGETIPVNRVVYQETNGKIYMADNTNLTHINRILGITTSSVDADETTYVASLGKITMVNTMSAGNIYFLGVNGILTLLAPTNGFTQIIGVADATNSFVINLTVPPIIL